jgi:hypothetical protein
MVSSFRKGIGWSLIVRTPGEDAKGVSGLTGMEILWARPWSIWLHRTHQPRHWL